MNDTRGPLSQRRILVVDDDEISRLVAFEILADLGAEVHLAENSEKAMRLADTNRYDLLVLDLHLPDMHGTELASAIEAHDDSLRGKIVFLTAQENDVANQKPDPFRGRDVFTKPLNPKQFLQYFHNATEITDTTQDTVKSHLNIPGIDISAGIKNFMGQEQAFFTTLRLFPEYSSKFVEDYEKSLRNKNTRECHRLAHSLKGSSAMIGAKKIHQISTSLEYLCETSENWEHISQKFHELKESIFSVNTSLKNETGF